MIRSIIISIAVTAIVCTALAPVFSTIVGAFQALAHAIGG